MKSKLHCVIEEGDLSTVQVRVLEIAYGQVEIVQAEVVAQEKCALRAKKRSW